ncbi:unnamed protein product [Rhodiola kirilowii]
MSSEDKFDAEKRTDDSMNFHSAHMSSDWPYNLACEGSVIGSSSCASDPIMNSCPSSWTAAPNVEFRDIDVGNSASFFSMLEHARGSSELVRPMFDGGWDPLSKGGLFVPNGPGVLLRSLSQFPSDSGFIERAARLSCFGSGNFSGMPYPFAAPDSISPLLKSRPVARGPNGVDGLRPLPFENEVNVARASTLNAEYSGQNQTLSRNESVVRPLDEPRHGRGASSNESDEANLRGCDGQEERSMLEGAGGATCSAGGYNISKRKRAGQSARDNKVNNVSPKRVEGAGHDGEPQLRIQQKPSPGDNNNTYEKTEHKSHGTNPQKDEYIHVRARRGQATNSHSLAERVRREKISERMKFLQDLVPGCSKVTGKAVMLDEIINYVRSLQRQVEFLSMKLATVNPPLDFDIESLLTKDMFQPRAGPSSSLGFLSNNSMPYPHLTPKTAQFQASLPVSGSSLDPIITMGSHLAAVGYKDTNNPQLPNMWDDELHNVVHMGFGNSSDPSKSHELDDSHQSDPMKLEP